MLKYIIFIVVAVIVVAGVALYRNGSQPASAPVAPADATVAVTPVDAAVPAATGTPITNSKQVSMKDGLIIEDTVVGSGAEAKTGDLVTVHYVGTLTDGKKFDASRDHGAEGFTFPLGQGMVIKGWEEGVVGMKVGGTRKLTIPPALGYGVTGAGGGVIPPNATLLFTVELLSVRTK